MAFAAGIFFWGYFLFEVPSNLMLQKVGARLWMCRICVTWGLLSMLHGLCEGADQLLASCAFCWAPPRPGFIPAWCFT